MHGQELHIIFILWSVLWSVISITTHQKFHVLRQWSGLTGNYLVEIRTVLHSKSGNSLQLLHFRVWNHLNKTRTPSIYALLWISRENTWTTTGIHKFTINQNNTFALPHDSWVSGWEVFGYQKKIQLNTMIWMHLLCCWMCSKFPLLAKVFLLSFLSLTLFTIIYDAHTSTPVFLLQWFWQLN